MNHPEFSAMLFCTENSLRYQSEAIFVSADRYCDEAKRDKRSQAGSSSRGNLASVLNDTRLPRGGPRSDGPFRHRGPVVPRRKD